MELNMTDLLFVMCGFLADKLRDHMYQWKQIRATEGNRKNKLIGYLMAYKYHLQILLMNSASKTDFSKTERLFIKR